MMCAGSNNTFDARSFTIFEIDFNTVHVGKARLSLGQERR